MAAASNKNLHVAPDLDAAAERIRETNDRITRTGRKLTAVYLDGVEKYTARVVDAERKLGEKARVERVGTLLSAHADLTQDVVKAGVSATRELITA
jgi:hypothetical protein